MAVFTPPTEEYGLTSASSPRLANRCLQHFGTAVRGINVYYLSDGTVTEVDPDSESVFWTAAEGTPYVAQVWWGSTETAYTLTSAQAAALTTAGYTVT